MLISAPAGRHLTYCTNVHAGESWEEVRALFGREIGAVKRRVSPHGAFGVGLRLGARAARELGEPARLAEARAALAEHGLYVFTLNGFPYGSFHGTRIKEAVYRPDWTEEARVQYTLTLAHVLAALLPEGVTGSISTVPVCFRQRPLDAGDLLLAADHLARVVAALVGLERERGVRIALALEPEPACLLETSREAIPFLEEQVFRGEVAERFASLARVERSRAESTLRRHLGVCLDACHASVEFEPPVEALAALRRAGISVPKIQVSAGLIAPATPEALDALAAFADDVYLHQVVARRAPGGELVRFVDLPEALAAAPTLGADTELRVHFHVPVFEERLSPFTSTRCELEELLLRGELGSTHLEVETYTFGLLPPQHRRLSLDEAVARELAWTKSVLDARGES